MQDPTDKPPVRPDLEAYLESLRAAEGSRGGRKTASGRRRRLRSPSPSGLWGGTLQWYLAAAVTILLACLTYTRNGWIPLLSGADLGIHEFGHMVFFWAPTLIVQLAGSFMQVAAPLALCGYFFWKRDRLAVILTVAWAAESVNNVSVYIYDATRMVLPLFNDDGSGAGHDWHNILGRLGLLGSTDQIAYAVRGLSVLLFAAALSLAVWWFAQPRRRLHES
jgi:hypothetical protein